MYIKPYIHDTEKKPVNVFDTDFSYNKRIEREYYSRLNQVNNQIDEILWGYDANDPMSSIDVTQALEDYSNSLLDWATDLVGGVVYNLNIDDERAWRSHSAAISKHLKWEVQHVPLEPIMADYINENVKLIKSLPLTAAQKVQQMVLKNLYTGEYRADELSEKIRGLGSITKSRAKLIARTEIAKMSTGLTKARSEFLNIPWYIWKTSGDIRVRSSHQKMNKVLVRWSDPASPEELDKQKRTYGHYHPGQIFNCRCFAQPVIRIEDITFPTKVYYNGQIQTMTREKFVELAGNQMPIAA